MSYVRVDATLVIILLLLTCTSCSSKPNANQTDTVTKGKVKSPYPVNEVFKLERESVQAFPIQIAGQELWTYVPQLKVTRANSEPLPAAANDLWVWAVFVSGSPSEKEVEDVMLKNLSHTGMPKNATMSIDNTTPALDGKKFRYDRADLKLTFAEGAPSDNPNPLMFSVLLAPESVDERWRAADTKSVQFFLMAYDFMSIGKSGPEQTKPPLPRGVAAVCLCGFESEFVVLSRPLVLSLEGKSAAELRK